jgi:tetratricopeptide (TPR) repeat protein
MNLSLLQMAEHFIQYGELGDAQEALAEHLLSHPADPAALRLRLEIRLRADDWHGALADALALPDPTPHDLMRRSVIWERMGQRADARAAMQQAVSAAPDDQRMAERLLQLYDNPRAALSVVEGQLRTHDQPTHLWRWQQWAGDLYQQLGEIDHAVARYSIAIELMLTPQRQPFRWAVALIARLFLARAELYRQQGQHDLALADYDQAAERIPDEPMIAFGRALVSVRTAADGAQHSMPAAAATAAATAVAVAVANCRAAYQQASVPVQAQMRQQWHALTAQYPALSAFTLADTPS